MFRCVVDHPLVLGEVCQDLGVHVVGHYRNIIVWFKLLRESIGSITHVVNEVIAVAGEFTEQNGGDGEPGALESDHRLNDAVFIYAEILLLQSRHELVGLLQDDPTSTVTTGTSTWRE